MEGWEGVKEGEGVVCFALPEAACGRRRAAVPTHPPTATGPQSSTTVREIVPNSCSRVPSRRVHSGTVSR